MCWLTRRASTKSLTTFKVLFGSGNVAFGSVPRDNLAYEDWVHQGGLPSQLPEAVLVLWATLPMNPVTLLKWREELATLDPPRLFSILQLPPKPPSNGWKKWLDTHVKGLARLPLNEDLGLQVGSLVLVPPLDTPGRRTASQRGYEPFVVTVPPDGALAPVLERLDAVRRTFLGMCPEKLDDKRKQVHKALDDYLKAPNRETEDSLSKQVEKNEFHEFDRTSLPRVLLLGESGSGKTVLVRYLAEHSRGELAFNRVPIPGHLGREEDFELEVQGYCKGAYTGASDEGSRGILGELIGGLVFFDEIGDASPTIQAKLLVYLDDYIVKPRGVATRGYYCPTLVVAATNRDVFREGLLRQDLLNRFNVVIRVPALKERSSEIDLQIDLLIQLESQSSPSASKYPIRIVGSNALSRLRKINFKDINFRALERVIKGACDSARGQQRDYLLESDISEEKGDVQPENGQERIELASRLITE